MPKKEIVTEKKPKKPKSKARKIVEWVLFGFFGALCAVVVAGNIHGMATREDHYGQSIRFGVGSFIVLTTSMEPEIKQDDAIITFAQDVTTFKSRLEKGETIDVTFVNVPIDYAFVPESPQFQRENGGQLVVTNQVMTHRLMEVHVDESIPMGKGRYIFVAAGINHQGDFSLMGQYQLFTEKQYLGVVILKNGVLGKVFDFIISPLGLILLLLVPAIYLIVASSMDIFKALKETDEPSSATVVDGGKLSSVKGEDRERLKKELLEELIRAKKENAAKMAAIEQNMGSIPANEPVNQASSEPKQTSVAVQEPKAQEKPEETAATANETKTVEEVASPKDAEILDSKPQEPELPPIKEEDEKKTIEEGDHGDTE